MLKVAEECLSACGGCEMTILDIGEPLLELLTNIEFIHMPAIMDHKYYGQAGEKGFGIPEADVGLISGSIRNEENIKVAREMREKCRTIIALGSCANFGGVPALANMFNLKDMMDTVYRSRGTALPAENPCMNIPSLKERAYTLNEVIKVDLELPGCPPPSATVVSVLMSLLEGKPFKLAERSVCDSCPTRKWNKMPARIRRPLENMGYVQNQKPQNMRCLIEQGYLCLGPVTRAGCSGDDDVPRCIRAYMACRGCFGPISVGANQMADMMGILFSMGLDPRQIEDRPATFNRFVGVMSHLKPPVR